MKSVKKKKSRRWIVCCRSNRRRPTMHRFLCRTRFRRMTKSNVKRRGGKRTLHAAGFQWWPGRSYCRAPTSWSPDLRRHKVHTSLDCQPALLFSNVLGGSSFFLRHIVSRRARGWTVILIKYKHPVNYIQGVFM